MKQRILQQFVFVIFWLISLLPFWVLYRISDVAAWCLYYIFGYRRAILQANVDSAFAERSAAAREDIIREFYAFFCDYAVETLKLLTISPQHIQRRMRMQGVEQLEAAMQTNGLVFIFLGHYGNWEWVSSLPLWFQQSDSQSSQLYRPLNNKAFDYLFLRIRSRFGSHNISKYEAIRQIVRMKQKGVRSVVGFISDQSPGRDNIHSWTHFMHRDTPVYTGTERIAKKVNAAVFFAHVVRKRRGHYVLRYEPMTLTPRQWQDFDITDAYMQHLEQMIQDDPALWLWTHNRWKYADLPHDIVSKK